MQQRAASASPPADAPTAPPPRTGAGDESTPRGRWARYWSSDERVIRAGPGRDWALLAVTAVLYLWDLSASGYANDYYAAAVKSGTESWKVRPFGVVGLRQLDHGGQATCIHVGDGAVGPDLRVLLVRDAGPPGAHGGRHGGSAVRRGEALVLLGGRSGGLGGLLVIMPW